MRWSRIITALVSSVSFAQPAIISAYSDLHQIVVKEPFSHHVERVMPPVEAYLVTLATPTKTFNMPADSQCIRAVTANTSTVTLSLSATCRVNFIAHNVPEAGRYPISVATYQQAIAHNRDTQALIADAKEGAVSRRTLEKHAINIMKKQQQDPMMHKKYVVVIDPGHGGGDSGAIAHGIMEKHLVLSIAKQLQKILIARGNYAVYLTRDTDDYVTLADRVRYAEYHEADLLLSLHLDQSSNSAIHGYRLFTLSESGATLAASRQPVAAGSLEALQVDLKQLTTTLSSMRFADTLDHALEHVMHTHVASPKFAGFTILQSISVPSILIELGFISHEPEAKRFAKSSYQITVADAMANAIDQFFVQSTRIS